jgi:hypothetical protein
MKRRYLLAAELFSYSYPHYRERLEAGNERFRRLMPRDVDVLEQADEEDWDDARVARELEMEPAAVPDWRQGFRRAREVVDAADPAESFRAGVRQSIQNALAQGLSADDPAAIERLVVQVCYRAADLGYLLEDRGQKLSHYSRALRAQPEELRDAEPG